MRCASRSTSLDQGRSPTSESDDGTSCPSFRDISSENCTSDSTADGANCRTDGADFTSDAIADADFIADGAESDTSATMSDLHCLQARGRRLRSPKCIGWASDDNDATISVNGDDDGLQRRVQHSTDVLRTCYTCSMRGLPTTRGRGRGGRLRSGRS